MESKTLVLWQQKWDCHKSCLENQECQETASFKGTEHEGVDMCEDGCVWFRPKIFGIALLFAWYDMWLGVFWCKKKKWLYALPFPMLGVILKFRR